MAQIPLLLELSERHLPPGVVDTLPAIAELSVTCTAFGTLLRVPTPAQQSGTTLRLPAGVVTIL